MTNPKLVTGVVLAAAAFVLVLPPFLESTKLLFPGVGPYLALVGIVPGSEPAWVAPVFGATAVALASAAFVVSWKQRSPLVTGLLVVGGIIYITGTLTAVAYLFGLVVPGPILGVISGAGILGLGIAKWLRGERTAAVIAR